MYVSMCVSTSGRWRLYSFSTKELYLCEKHESTSSKLCMGIICGDADLIQVIHQSNL